jgi:phage-related minor tail protein
MALIKGITIDIDGNTTGLSEALKDVNKNIGGVSSELRQVEKLLKLDPGNTELIAQKQELLSRAIQETSGKLNTLKEAKRQADDQFSKGEISEAQYRSLTREIASTENKLKGFNDELKETNNTTKKIDLNKLGSQMGDLGQKAGKVAAEVAKVAAALTVALAVAVGAVVKKMFDGAVSAGKFADDLITLSNKTNVSTDTLQKWSYAAKFIDTDIEVMTGSMRKMTKVLGTNEEAFNSLGVKTRGTGGEFRSQEEIFNDTIDALGRVENATQRDILAQELFGKSAAELNPLIKAGGDELKRLGDEAIASGLVISGPVLEQFGKFDDTMEQLGAQFSALGKNIIAGFMPAIQGLVEPVKNAIGEINVILSDGIQEGDIDQISTIVSNMVTNLAQQLLEMLPKLIEFLVPMLTNLINMVAEILPTLIPVLLQAVLDIVTAIMTAAASNVEPIINMVITLLTMIANFFLDNMALMLDTGIRVLTALIEGIVKELPTMIPKIIAVLLDIVMFLLDNIDLIIEMGIQILIALIEGIVASIPMLVEKMPLIIEKIITALIKLAPQLAVAAIQIILALAVGIIQQIPTLIGYMPKVVMAIVNGVKAGISDIRSIGIDMIDGLWQGIKGSFGWIKDKIKGWVGDVMKFIKKLFGIASPSKVMKNEVGMNLGLGVASGIEGSLGAVKRAMGKLNSEVTSSVNPIINPTANSNPLILQIENFINDRGVSVQQLMQEAEFLRRSTALAGGTK